MPGSRLLTLAAALAFAAPALAHDAMIGPIRVGHAWTPPAVAGATAIVAFPLLNTGTEPDRLVSVESDAAGAAVLRRGEAVLDAIDLAPNRPVALGPRGAHVALQGLKAPAREGARIPLTLRFERAGSIDYEAYVESTPGK